ncbi:MAG: hypothetical protein OXG24_03990 [Gammaproteobacteria bacterium]|nr:hypothetical protein [Gammaproteobacteria bacterium]
MQNRLNSYSSSRLWLIDFLDGAYRPKCQIAILFDLSLHRELTGMQVESQKTASVNVGGPLSSILLMS